MHILSRFFLIAFGALMLLVAQYSSEYVTDPSQSSSDINGALAFGGIFLAAIGCYTESFREWFWTLLLLLFGAFLYMISSGMHTVMGHTFYAGFRYLSIALMICGLLAFLYITTREAFSPH